ncbi:hypothetical protein AAZX31_09G103400 [Glycine max]
MCKVTSFSRGARSFCKILTQLGLEVASKGQGARAPGTPGVDFGGADIDTVNNLLRVHTTLPLIALADEASTMILVVEMAPKLPANAGGGSNRTTIRPPCRIIIIIIDWWSNRFAKFSFIHHEQKWHLPPNLHPLAGSN